MLNKILIALVLMTGIAGASPITEALNSNANALQADINAVNNVLVSLGYPAAAAADPIWEGEITIYMVKQAPISRQQLLEGLYQINVLLRQQVELQDVYHVNFELQMPNGDSAASASMYIAYTNEADLAKQIVDSSVFYSVFDQTVQPQSIIAYQQAPTVNIQPAQSSKPQKMVPDWDGYESGDSGDWL